MHHNVLLYVENLGAKVTGVIEYQKLNANGDLIEEVFQLQVNEFVLDLNEGEELIKNFNFKEFWNFYAEYE